MKYLEELKQLNLPSDQYAVFGGGVLAIRGLRENEDLDIVVKKELWKKLIKKYKSKSFINSLGHIIYWVSIGNIEIFEEDPIMDEVGHKSSLVDTADIIKGMRFVRLVDMIKWKKIKNREKDRIDIKLIEDYLDQHNN